MLGKLCVRGFTDEVAATLLQLQPAAVDSQIAAAPEESSADLTPPTPPRQDLQQPASSQLGGFVSNSSSTPADPTDASENGSQAEPLGAAHHQQDSSRAQGSLLAQLLQSVEPQAAAEKLLRGLLLAASRSGSSQQQAVLRACAHQLWPGSLCR